MLLPDEGVCACMCVCQARLDSTMVLMKVNVIILGDEYKAAGMQSSDDLMSRCVHLIRQLGGIEDKPCGDAK